LSRLAVDRRPFLDEREHRPHDGGGRLVEYVDPAGVRLCGLLRGIVHAQSLRPAAGGYG
jgi:hypothetical protein